MMVAMRQIDAGGATIDRILPRAAIATICACTDTRRPCAFLLAKEIAHELSLVHGTSARPSLGRRLFLRRRGRRSRGMLDLEPFSEPGEHTSHVLARR